MAFSPFRVDQELVRKLLNAGACFSPHPSHVQIAAKSGNGGEKFSLPSVGVMFVEPGCTLQPPNGGRDRVQSKSTDIALHRRADQAF
jgi:hypothetical protein